MSVRAFLVDLDTVAGVGAVAYAITSLFVPELQTVVHVAVAGGFGLSALSRGYLRHRRKMPD